MLNLPLTCVYTQTLPSSPQPISIPTFIKPIQLITEQHLTPAEALAQMLPYVDTH